MTDIVRIDALIGGIRAECNDLEITDDQAIAILAHFDYMTGTEPASVAPLEVATEDPERSRNAARYLAAKRLGLVSVLDEEDIDAELALNSGAPRT